ncbi:glycerol dehydratase reactivase beta/small subunit family protein [Sphaerisporangium perillae]|uniref:glycerol dehydratase reactivase beta/small subunit family protein n=1 Tax=Sphaerisporangium perillae TaxID=2935860 RepID=UPI002010C306|nr:glycerol dehydratase reactivase beta/small subunit family protein [Sphaerisporangium perillae]
MRHTPADDRPFDHVGQNRPAVVVLCHPDPGNRHCVREINAGMEEEGVPCRTENAADGSARELALAAAQASNLDVGVGVDSVGNICVHHAKLPPDAPAVAGPATSARTMGHNAARLVAGLPFKQQEGVRRA